VEAELAEDSFGCPRSEQVVRKWCNRKRIFILASCRKKWSASDGHQLPVIRAIFFSRVWSYAQDGISTFTDDTPARHRSSLPGSSSSLSVGIWPSSLDTKKSEHDIYSHRHRWTCRLVYHASESTDRVSFSYIYYRKCASFYLLSAACSLSGARS
jgi:hypothetical protein